VTLDDLSYPDEGLPFAVARPPPWHEAFKRKWLSIAKPTGCDWRDRKYLYAELINVLELDVDDTELSFDYEIDAMLCLLLSLERGTVVGSRQKNLTEVLHTFLTTAARKPLTRIIIHALQISGHGTLLLRPKTRDLLSRALAAPQMGYDSIEARVARSLFPAWAVSRPSIRASRSAPARS
jgi:hypothetical protein